MITSSISKALDVCEWLLVACDSAHANQCLSREPFIGILAKLRCYIPSGYDETVRVTESDKTQGEPHRIPGSLL